MQTGTLLAFVGILILNPSAAFVHNHNKRFGNSDQTSNLIDTFSRDERKSVLSCPRERQLDSPSTCPDKCTSNVDCPAKGQKCLCFGECGLSCIHKRKGYCRHPERLQNGKIMIVGSTETRELTNSHEKIPAKSHILFQCNKGFTIIDGPLKKSCEGGLWVPSGNPECVSVSNSASNWLHTGRVKRRAIKTGGSSTIVRGNKGPGNSNTGLGPRRGTKKKGSRPDDDEYEPTPIFCPNLDELDDYLQIQVIQSGEDHNETFSAGAIVKVSCLSGFGVNVPNETVRCDKGKWKPKIPQCSALPCKTPFVDNAVFYEGSKPLYFQEIKKHKTNVDVRCKKGYKLRGPPRFHCWYGEWDVQDSPECLPAPCIIPVLDFGQYLVNYRANTTVQHGTELDYICGGEYKKIASGPVRCELGEWKPTKPTCYRSNSGSSNPFETETRPGSKLVNGKPSSPVVKRSCGPPPKENGSYTFEGGLPIDWNRQLSFQDSTDVLYRCSTLKAKARNRWKITCEDGTWTGIGNLTCDSSAPPDQFMSLPDVNMINGSCTFRKSDPFIVTFYNDQIINQDPMEFPHGAIITSRCIDIGKFRLEGAIRRKCLSGQWMGITPRCEGLSQIHDYAHDKSPTILFRYVNGSIVQSNDGDLIVYPGTTLHMECLWIRKYGKPRWDTSNKQKEYPEGWAAGEKRDSSLEYRLTIENAQSEDSGTYSCVTPTRHSHQIKIIVKASSCQPLPPHPDLEYSTNNTILGTKVIFKCKYKNSLIGAREIFCSESGRWSAPLPRCENVECPNISLLPAMAPLAYTSVTKNGTLKKNETAPPKIHVESTQVGGKVTYSCPPGYMIEGAKVAYCNDTGEWSAPMPLCKEVECPDPPELENGEVTRAKPPYKSGDLAKYECDSGFVMEGQQIIACQDNGKWSKLNMKCSTSCSYQGTVIHGSLLSNMKFNYEVGETVEFECNEGYFMTGSRILKCLKTGEWSAPIPTCNLCKDGRCKN